MGSCVIQHEMPQVHPRIRMRLRPPQALPWHFLTRMLFHLRQHEEPFVGARGSRTRGVGPVTSARTAGPIDRAVLQRGRQRALDMRPQRGEFWLRSPRHRPSAPGTLDHVLIAGHRHLRHSVIGQEA
jgi:hypothetical protein